MRDGETSRQPCPNALIRVIPDCPPSSLGDKRCGSLGVSERYRNPWSCGHPKSRAQPHAHLHGKRFPATVRRREGVGSVGGWRASFRFEMLCCIVCPSREEGRATARGKCRLVRDDRWDPRGSTPDEGAVRICLRGLVRWPRLDVRTREGGRFLLSATE